MRRWLLLFTFMFTALAISGCNLRKLAGDEDTKSSAENDDKDSDDEDGDDSGDEDGDDEDEPKKKKKKKKKKKGKKGSKKKRSSASDDDDKPAPLPPPPLPPPPPAANYFTDATSIPTLFTAKVGGTVRIQDMLIYPAYARADIQDPNKLLHVDRYMLRGGFVGDSKPVKFVGGKPTEALLKESTFDITTIDFKIVPQLVTDAQAQLKLEEGKTTHIILKRNIPFSNDVQWRVYVSGTRGSGSVTYTPKGAVKKVYN